MPDLEAKPIIAENGAAKTRGGAGIDIHRVSAEFAALVPLEFARERLVISQGVDSDGRETLVVSGREEDDLVVHNIAARLGRPVVAVRGDAEAIAAALDEMAQARAGASSSARSSASEIDAGDGLDERDLAALLAADERDLLQTAGRAPVVRLVNGLLFEALSRRASDVHAQPEGDGLVVRFRIDGALVEARRLPQRLLLPLVSRVKVMGQMDIAERRLPQDGRAAVTIAGKEVDLRISTLPTARGERLVIRLLDKRSVELFELERLGMPAATRKRFESACVRPYGMVLVTGPTGSGKTTTLYSVLCRLDTIERNVMTLEDPIEYELPGISQSQVNPRKGVTFATGLRHILRQDPDVIMVGEIRDAETARIAVQSALTGHLVFSTLHTNNAASAVTRLVDLGVEPYLVNASLSAVLAQRLVRMACRSCLGRAVDDAEGCAACGGAGFRGRTGLFELLVMDQRLRDLVAQGATASALHNAARAGGMQTLREAGLAAVTSGLTTRSEVDRATLVDEFDEDEPDNADSHEREASGAARGEG